MLENIHRNELAEASTSPALNALAKRMSRDSHDLQKVSHPDGRQSVNMKGRFSTVIAAVPDAQGKLQARCFTDHQELVNALSQTSPVAPADHDN